MAENIENILPAVAILSFLIILTVFKYIYYESEIKYIKMEINRSYTKSEKQMWKKRLKTIYFKIIPIIGLFIKKE